MNKKQNKIGFILLGVETLHFKKKSPPEKDFFDSIELYIATNFEIDDENKIISSGFGVKYIFEDKSLIDLSMKCVFKIKPETWDKFKKGNKFKIPLGFALHLAMLTVGTARGILHCKTEKTAYKDLILPTINLTEIIKDDIEITINDF